MKNALRISILAAICVAAGFFAFARPIDDPLDSLKINPNTQKLIFENQFVRVIDNIVPVGVTEPMHSHPHGVVVYLSDGKNEVTTQDGKTTVSVHSADTAVWSEPIIHAVKNIGPAPTHTIRIDVKY